jgi:hypothetical protein
MVDIVGIILGWSWVALGAYAVYGGVEVAEYLAAERLEESLIWAGILSFAFGALAVWCGAGLLLRSKHSVFVASVTSWTYGAYCVSYLLTSVHFAIALMVPLFGLALCSTTFWFVRSMRVQELGK